MDMLVLPWMPGSEVFDKARASGLRVANWQDAILVNMLGKRFYDETASAFTANGYNSISSYTQDSYLNAKNVKYSPNFFLSANSLPGLASAIKMQYQRVPMPPDNLEKAVTRYNSFVDSGVDADFGKPQPLHKIARPPFYAAWATPNVHDTRAGLRISARCEVMDMNGAVIAGLYCGGESAGGFSQHGLARAICQGLIAGTNAVA